MTVRLLFQKDVVQENLPINKAVYQNFDSLKRGIEKSSLTEWIISDLGTEIHLKTFDPSLALPKYHLIIDKNLQIDIAVFNWKLPSKHEIYGEIGKSVKYTRVSSLILRIKEQEICPFVGLKTMILAVVECIPYLLSSGMPYVLTERFMQDNAEEYFGINEHWGDAVTAQLSNSLGTRQTP